MQFHCMKKFLFFIISIAVCQVVSAQNNDKTFFLFSVKPHSTDDAFISQLNLDSASTKYLSDTSIIQSSNISFIKDDKTSTNFHGYADSAQFLYPLRIKNHDTTVIKGSFAWLGKKADEFPSGEENFEITVSPEKASISAHLRLAL